MDKLIHLRANFTEKSIDSDSQNLIITGYASTVSKDRAGDIIEKSAWTKGGLANYLKNPIILAFHNHSKPIGKMIEYSIDEVGLKITAKISKAAGDIIDLIKDEVLQAFSVGVRVKEADYDSEKDIFFIKDVELLEVSVVSVPANQDSLFSVAKCFDTEKDYAEFKQQFIIKNDEPSSASTTIPKEEEFIMDSTELQEMISKALSNELSKQKEEEAAARAAAEQEAARRAEISAIAKSNATALVDDLQKAMKQSEEAFAQKLAELQKEIAEKSEEIGKITRDRSKVTFPERSGKGEVDVKSVSEAALLGIITNKAATETKLGKQLLEKAVNISSSWQVPSDDWEQTLSNRLEQDIQLQLVVAPLFREIPMQAARQIISVNPDPGYANWVAAGQITGAGPTARDGTTTGSEITLALTEVTLSTKKLAAKAYLTDETEEDTIIPILPLIYEGLARSHAKQVDWSFLNNDSSSSSNGNSKEFVDGLITRSIALSTALEAGGTTSTQVIASNSTKFTSEHVLKGRKLMGKWGINPSDVVGILSVDAWYDLLEDAAFGDMADVGAAAQKLTGEVGRMYGIRFVVSDQMPSEGNGAAAMVFVNPMNYLVPRLRGMTVQTDYSVEYQRRLLVATQRLGFSPIISAAKSVACVRYDISGA